MRLGHRFYASYCSKPFVLGLLSFYVVLALWRQHNRLYPRFEFRAVDQTAELLRRFDKESPKRDVIAYLTHLWRAEALARSIAGLFLNFNRQFRYPVVVFYEKPMNITNVLMHVSAQRVLLKDEYDLLEFVCINLTLPKDFFPAHGTDQDNLNFMPVFSHLFPGYHRVLQFWFSRVFDEPFMQSVRYFWRMDTDSLLLSPVNYDIFKFMAKNGFLYGYRAELTDSLHVTVGLWDFAESFINRNAIQVVPTNGLLEKIPPPGFTRRNTRVPLYYNNFEVVHVPTFQQHPGIRLFAKQVDASEKIYEQRWGDAPLRYVSVNMFLDKAKFVHQFCDIDYQHQQVFNATCRQPLL